jgi:N-acetylmuramoyl-L-alanine amidase
MTPRQTVLSLFTQPARLTLALTLYGEASGEAHEGRVAVAWCIVNRSKVRHQTIQCVCLSPWQFSCWPVGAKIDSNQARVLALAERVLAGEALADHPVWLDCLAIADNVIAAAIPDGTDHADHYMTQDRYQQVLANPETDPARWCLGMTRTVTVGHHLFFRSQEAVA